MSVIQRASEMEDLYANDIDPWGNARRGLYNILMKELVEKVESHTDKESLEWCEIGAGGANVMRGIKHNATLPINFTGVDLSETAIKALIEDTDFGNEFYQMDLETYIHDPEDPPVWNTADVISWIEVLYYFGDKRPWKISFDEFWKGVKPGAIVIVADSLIPYQYRDYLKKASDAILLESYTDQSIAVSKEKRDNGSEWTRWLKVRVYRKN